MKKLSFILVLFLIFYNCSTDENGSSDLAPDMYKINAINLKDAGFNVSNVNIKAKESTKSLSSEGSKANGHFNSNPSDLVVIGERHITFSSEKDGEYGNFVMRGLINVKGDVICTVVDGNRAVIQLIITHVGEMPGWAEYYFKVGYTLFYLFEDNGEGVNAPKDRYYNYWLYTDETWDFCFEMDPTFFIDFNDGDPTAFFLETGKKNDQIQIR